MLRGMSRGDLVKLTGSTGLAIPVGALGSWGMPAVMGRRSRPPKSSPGSNLAGGRRPNAARHEGSELTTHLAAQRETPPTAARAQSAIAQISALLPVRVAADQALDWF